MRFTGVVTVNFKKSVLEPQGQAVLLSLKETGHENVSLVRVGKHIEVVIEAENKEDAYDKISKIAEELLYNPVMETCEIQILNEAR
ncbi:MAG: phosphoribosylformylglycinamidine synthase subunit PurS [Spirochaetia bacterium]|nr:phosphoribosylformylglycinamidine synthase subunit PurS [Spirochaetia bacterium]